MTYILYGFGFSLINKLNIKLASVFKISNIDTKVHYLGMKVFKERNNILAIQTIYIDQLLYRHQMFNCRLLPIVMVESFVFGLYS